MLKRRSYRKLPGKVFVAILASALVTLLPTSASFAGTTGDPGAAPGDSAVPGANAKLPHRPDGHDKAPLAAQHRPPATSTYEAEARRLDQDLRAKSARTLKTLSDKERQIRTLIEQKALQDKQPIELWGKIKELAN